MISSTASIKQYFIYLYTIMSFQKLCCCLKSALGEKEGIDVEVNCISSCCAGKTRALQGVCTNEEPDGEVKADILRHKQSSKLQPTRSSSSCFRRRNKDSKEVVKKSTSLHSSQKCEETLSDEEICG